MRTAPHGSPPAGPCRQRPAQPPTAMPRWAGLEERPCGGRFTQPPLEARAARKQSGSTASASSSPLAAEAKSRRAVDSHGVAAAPGSAARAPTDAAAVQHPDTGLGEDGIAVDGNFVCKRCGFPGKSALSLSMHISQAHRPRTWIRPNGTRCLEAEIYRRLKLLDPEARRRLLSQRFTQAQRLALEQWILNQPLAQGRKRRISAMESDRSKRRRTDGSPLPKIWTCRDGRRAVYRASAIIGPFRLYTRHVADKQAAECYCQVLTSIRQRVAAASDADSAAGLFARAVAEEPARLGAGAMGLSFDGVVAARHWVGRQLRTPRFRAADVQAGLRAWKRLSDARNLMYSGRANLRTILQRHSPAEVEETWRRLRRAYLEVWEEAGRDGRKVEAQLCALERKQRAQRSSLAAVWAQMQQQPHRRSWQRRCRAKHRAEGPMGGGAAAAMPPEAAGPASHCGPAGASACRHGPRSCGRPCSEPGAAGNGEDPPGALPGAPAGARQIGAEVPATRLAMRDTAWAGSVGRVSAMPGGGLDGRPAEPSAPGVALAEAGRGAKAAPDSTVDGTLARPTADRAASAGSGVQLADAPRRSSARAAQQIEGLLRAWARRLAGRPAVGGSAKAGRKSHCDKVALPAAAALRRRPPEPCGAGEGTAVVSGRREICF
uniref:Uncharacterized protein n=1 Tax=Alexandrium monilatum TaxID=311494 RepID=A0A7S4PTG7_9DINO